MGPLLCIKRYIMSKRMPPKWVSHAAPDPSPVEGVDNLPLPGGVNRAAVKQADMDSERTPCAMDPKANGDNPSIADSINFASGTDVRSYSGAGPRSDATPGMPGAK